MVEAYGRAVARSPQQLWSLEDVFNRFDRWASKGIWQYLFEALRQDPDDEWHSIDHDIALINTQPEQEGARSTASVGLVVA
jgi:hypothetical protein